MSVHLDEIARLEAHIARHEQREAVSAGPLLAIPELAQAVGKSARTIRRLIADGRLKHVKRKGRKLLYHLSDAQAALATRPKHDRRPDR